MDMISKKNKSVIHHGGNSQRVYVMKYGDKHDLSAIQSFISFAKDQGYGKVIAKVPETYMQNFSKLSYQEEACIKGFFNGKENCHFMSYFIDHERQIDTKKKTLDDVIKKSLNISRNIAENPNSMPTEYLVSLLKKEHIPSMISVYKSVFETYPFPIFDPVFIENTMNDYVNYFGIFNGDKLIAIASSEKDDASKSVEMTDFATLTTHRGKGLASILLNAMESSMRKQGYKTFYTICRGISYGMNIVFAKQGYSFGGQLINNTNISGSIESMNIWYKC